MVAARPGSNTANLFSGGLAAVRAGRGESRRPTSNGVSRVSYFMNFPPKVYVATDYHEFLTVRQTLLWAGFSSVQYQELSNPGGRYVAVFYSDASASKNLIAATRRRLAEGQPAERPLRPAPVRPASE